MNATYLPDEAPTVVEMKICCSPAVADAAIRLVDLKYHLDHLTRSHTGCAIAGQIFPDWRGYGSFDPHSFAGRVLPFYKYATRPSGKRYRAMVPTPIVIGDSWRWLPRSLNEEHQKRVIDKAFATFEKSTPACAKTDCAVYFYVKQLGLVLAHEGKNRVALFRERELPSIPAIISEWDYPEAERIRIYELPGICVAVLDGRFVERVAVFHLVRELMQAYGIVIENNWPPQFPELAQVLANLDDSRRDNRSEAYAADMEAIKLDESCRETEIAVTLMDIDALRLPSLSRFLQGGAIFLLLILATAVSAERWPELQVLCAVATGAMGMLLMLPTLKLGTCKVRHLKSGPAMHHFFALRGHRLHQFREGIHEVARKTKQNSV